MKARLKPLLLLGLMFLAGIIFGVTATRIVVKHVIHRATTDPQFMRGEIEKKLNRDLRLRPEQKQQLHAISGRALEQLKLLRQDYNPRVAAVMENSEQELRAILDDAQKEKFDRMRRDRFLKSQGKP